MDDEPTGITGEFKEEDLLAVHLNGFASGREYERKRIVVWLRKERPHWDLNPLADDIEAGEHLR